MLPMIPSERDVCPNSISASWKVIINISLLNILKSLEFKNVFVKF